MPTSTAIRHPRLKETCDRCSNAKVRCSRDRQCTRCVSKGLPCVYSLSRRAGRRHGSKKIDSVSSSVNHSSSSSPMPMDSDMANFSADDSELDALYTWGFPAPNSGDLNSTLSRQMTFDDNLSDMNNLDNPMLLQQPALNYFPTMADAYTLSPHTMDHTDLPTSFGNTSVPADAPPQPQAPIMHRSPTAASTLSDASITSSQVDSVHDELTNLTDFAERMERKFDAVVRQRLQYRNMSLEFGVPDDLETPLLGGDCGEILDPQNGSRKGPDLAEMSFYYSLAELRRRLKWLREDVGVIRGMPC